MDFTIDNLTKAIRRAQCDFKRITKIRMRTQLFNYIASEIKGCAFLTAVDSECAGLFLGIRIIIDDTIDGLYKLEYEED